MPLRPKPTLPKLVATACVLLFTGGYVAFGQDQSATSDSASQEGAAIPFALPQSGPFSAAEIEVTNDQAIADWFRSAHADSATEAFSHWDEDEEISARCATCHSGEGFRDYHGLDGTPAGSVEGPIQTGGVVDCGTCHNAGLAQIKEVTFPSGLIHPAQGVEASCLTCHQGRSAGSNVTTAIAGLELDLPSAELRFINPHYATAAATWLGGYGEAGYHYDGKDYSGRFFHARPVSSCNSCHDPHTLEIAFEPCQTCHDANTVSDIRIARQSYDGSGDTSQGIRADIRANADLLMEMLEAYAEDVAAAPFVYDAGRHPYFFTDANGDGVADQNDGDAVPYNAWTPRSLRAAYNWKLVTADPGSFAHNPPYILELLYDTIEDLGGTLGLDIDDMGILR